MGIIPGISLLLIYFIYIVCVCYFHTPNFRASSPDSIDIRCLFSELNGLFPVMSHQLSVRTTSRLSSCGLFFTLPRSIINPESCSQTISGLRRALPPPFQPFGRTAPPRPACLRTSGPTIFACTAHSLRLKWLQSCLSFGGD